MKPTFEFYLLLIFIGGCTILLSLQFEAQSKRTETKFIEAIQKNDSINSVKYLNRDEKK